MLKYLILTIINEVQDTKTTHYDVFKDCHPLSDLIPFVQFKKRENILGRVLLLVKLQVKACNFTKSNIPPWVQSKSMDWFLHDEGLRHVRVKVIIW